MYSEYFVKELKDTISISGLIGKKISIKKRGRDFVACCPFHSEKTPSFSISDVRGIYHCFGCGKTGNIFNFVMETENINFKEAIEYLANLYGIMLPKVENIGVKRKDEIDEVEIIYKINEESCKFFENNIFSLEGKEALYYANKRGLSSKNIKKFRIGYAKNNYSDLILYLQSLGFSKDMMEKSGVIAKNDKDNYYDKFRNRLMFPVFSKNGKVIAFTGRILNNDMPKYMNSPETKIYVKGNVLFNYYFAKKAIYDNDFAVLVEGNMDAISLYINGVENVVAPMGTGITERQIQELWSATNNIFVCLDGDSAGQKASQRLSKLVLPIILTGKNINFVFLPKNVDPDDFVLKYGKSGFDELVKSSVSLSNYLLNNEMNDLNIDFSSEIIPEKKAMLEKNMMHFSSLITDGTLRYNFDSFYKSKLWKLNKGLKQNENTVLQKNQLKKIYGKNNIDLIENLEKKICFLLMKYPNLVNLLAFNNKLDIFSVPFLNDKVNLFLNFLEEFMDKNLLDIKIFYEKLEKNELSTYINSGDNFFNNSYISSLTEEKSLNIINLLLLEREIILLEFDLKESSMANNLEKAQNINKELFELKRKKNDICVNCDFL